MKTPRNNHVTQIQPHAMIRQKGLTIIEALIVISVLAALIFAVLTGYTTYNQRASVKDFTAGSIITAAGIRSAFRNVERTYANVTTAAVLAARVSPPEMLIDNTIVNPWGGPITFGPTDLNGATNNAFTMTSASIPLDECLQSGIALSGSFSAVSINSAVIKSATVPLTQEAIGDACTSETNNSVVLTYQ